MSGGRRVLPPELDALIASNINQQFEHVLFRGWVQKWKSATEVNGRLLVLTEYTLFTIKCGRFGNSVGNKYPLILLKKIKASPSSAYVCKRKLALALDMGRGRSL